MISFHFLESKDVLQHISSCKQSYFSETIKLSQKLHKVTQKVKKLKPKRRLKSNVDSKIHSKQKSFQKLVHLHVKHLLRWRCFQTASQTHYS